MANSSWPMYFFNETYVLTSLVLSIPHRVESASLYGDSAHHQPAADILQMDMPAEAPRRPLAEVAESVRSLLTNQFEAVEQRYSQLEAYNSGRITQESLHDLLRQCVVGFINVLCIFLSAAQIYSIPVQE